MEKSSTAGFWLAPQQKHLWQVDPDRGAVNATIVALFEGPVDDERLREALNEVVARHEILRTVYRGRPGLKIPLQVVLDACQPRWETLDWSQLEPAEESRRLEDLFDSTRHHLFDLHSGPVVFGCWVKLGAGRGALLVSVPSLASDTDSLSELVRELFLIYSGERRALTEEPLEYAQFAQWQNDLLDADDDNAKSAKIFWSQQNIDELGALPQESPKLGRFNPDSVCVHAGPTLTVLTSSHLKDVLLAGWQTFLWRLTGQAFFGTNVFFSGREHDELANAFGFIGKFLPISSRFDGTFHFRDIVSHVTTTREAAAEWQEYYAPVTDATKSLPVSFEFIESPGAQTHNGVRIHITRQEVEGEGYRLKLVGVRSGSELRLELHYDGVRLGRETVERWSGYLVRLLEGAAADPETPVGRLPMLGEEERRQLVEEWNRTEAEYPREKCFQELFEEQVERTPEREAVRCGEEGLSYRELNERANRLAHHLRSRGVGTDGLVGLCVERSAETMAAVLGILKAGGAYVPLTGDNPKARLAQQLAGVRVLVTETKQLGSLPEFAGPVVLLDQAEWSAQPASNPEKQGGPENLAYVIYTSGSTGVPKGVGVRHRNLVNYASFIAKRLEWERYPEGLQFATVSTLSADLGNTCIYPALMTGGCVHVIRQEVATDSAGMAEYNRQHPIDVLKIVPSHLAALLESNDGAGVLPRKFLILGGEALTPRLVEQVRARGAGCEIFNHYGPTETTVGSLTLKLSEYTGEAGASVPIGRPIANTQVYILDGQQQPVPIGVAGELYIAGEGVTAGYLNQPERTAERFVQNPYGAGLMYRTGDLARYGSDGNVEFLGRADDQVKIRGFRIELGEVEAALAECTGVKQAAVVAQADARGDKRLVAYVVGDGALRVEQLREELRQQLPEQMIPAAIVVMPKLPLNANGKLDRQRLPSPEEQETKAHIAPRTPTEEIVAGIWTEVLRRERLSVDDNFFEIGGHSLMATQVIARLRRSFGVDIAMNVIFEAPTVQGLALAVDARRAADSEDDDAGIVPVARNPLRSGRR